MRIGVFGATGVIGQRIVAEAVSRGHEVRAFTRNQSKIPADASAVTWQVADVLDADSVTTAITGLDVVVNAINAGDDIPDAIANADVLPSAARALLAALDRRPSTRLLIVGGAGSLEVQPGLQVVDVDGFTEQLPAALGVPPEYSKVVLAHREALNLYRLSNRDWTYLSPSAALVKSGDRTGRFRTGTNQLLVMEDGTSDISAEDLAMALIDEAERPQFIQRRFTVGY
ncbi:NAD(P)-dependent oxidoreductase [Kibdelosporangium aridum]|uniref:NAD(P)-dependent oxidoreductase n=1 Tax=Kibdelosporangium aridum TaxID=2030 RepID=UPI000A01EC9E|nr:NAD(P)H-binding protein [Kibdelosporangium aridum]